jgi:sugar phosphate isomerase/epimerase
MTRPNNLPTLGVALTLNALENVEGLRAFVFDHDRDLEIQDLVPVGALENDLWKITADRARTLLDGHHGRVGIHGPFEGLQIDTPDPEIRAIVQRRMNAAIDALIAIDGGRGLGHMVLHSPYSTWHWYNRGTHYDDTAAIFERTHRCLKDIVRRAGDHGLTLVLENCEDKDPAERVALAASFNSPAMRVSLDTGHAHYAHGVTGAPPVDVFVRTAGSALAHVHLQDADGVADRHWAIGRGTILWHSVFTALNALPEMPRLIVEMAHIRDAFASAAYLRERGLAI